MKYDSLEEQRIGHDILTLSPCTHCIVNCRCKFLRKICYAEDILCHKYFKLKDMNGICQ